MSVTRTVIVTQEIQVSVDESKFTPEFMSEFRNSFYPSFQSVDDHTLHLAQMYARGLYDESSIFIEGYGEPSEMGIKFKTVSVETEIV